jgi:putative phosphoribosyl transferase
MDLSPSSIVSIERGGEKMDGIFQNRRAAGQPLAKALEQRGYHGDGLLVLGIPRGGIPVADEVARALHAPLDLVISHKLRAPFQPELAIGAVTSGDHPPTAWVPEIVNEELVRELGVPPDYLEKEIRHQQAEIDRRLHAFRGDRPLLPVEGQTVIVVDDGMATGYTFRAALEGLRRQHPERLVAAVPVASRESLGLLREWADDVLCLATPHPFLAVGLWYDDFSETTDADVVAILQENWAQAPAPHPTAARARGPAAAPLSIG